ncbi:hypothetical protein ACTMKN_11015 [Bacteroides pyogenes]|uniref:Uncharacterized protein n=1 Tax=Bacteroides pyogenes TaxID=310300 RepID=A0A5D3EFL4_9BACE|nr:hypothetical protein [Bacteroides pyogenes]MBR8725513.1 hypothetical protein [Bacteroides pyogenes]MBR8737706.1 hypothetical protein [Bacteroides pyogenes]MBR8753248.1 hypothetical protein [Bacteroides pyogenes]MBR8794670.1 hypothetical protein [Bacteroides pyogenes]MCF2708149.1 hypothetical protein [Bacteroides pyogenes]
MKYDNIIAIDPDREKSGVAFLKPSIRQIEVSNLAFPALLDYLQYAKEKAGVAKETLVVVVEAGWMVRKSNFHEAQGCRAEKIAKDVGANHEAGRKIIEMCKHYRIEVVQHPPLIKCWKGKDRKITHEELVSFTGLIGRTNQDARDAALLAWSFANLPIRVKV